MKKNPGFTIIEVMVVLAIAALIISTVILGMGYLQKTQRARHNQDIAGKVLSALQDYKNSTGTIPTSDAEMTNYFTNLKSSSGDTPMHSAAANITASNAPSNTMLWGNGVKCTTGGVLVSDSTTYATAVGVSYWTDSNGAKCIDSLGNQS